MVWLWLWAEIGLCQLSNSVMYVLHTIGGKMSSENCEQGCGVKNYLAGSNLGETDYGERWKINKLVRRLLK